MIFNSLGLAPYESQYKQNSFFFTTDTGAIYEIYFTDGSSYFDDSVGFAPYSAMMGFRPTQEDQERKFDPRVAVTVARHIFEFLEDERNTLIFVCDPHDERQTQRGRLFNLWFLRFGFSEFFKKIDLGNNDVVLSFMFRHSSPFNEEIEGALPDVRRKCD
ncbi:hypothetical protein JAO76_02955 [Pontibacter sp. BT310]|uniref:GNAT family N-acetyltransferase n=1 Tax=Pontibacter populi TaxID=890055 RepID=A0ABS6X7K9_9BACT|nr:MULTISPECIES: DUF6169 family protein [Pontibacter]MBJ6117135.1 hypothetical protein [Pontibacter sp. BT310]MBR0569559.1 hypothetical protein [Microvirga sp. STS03]MBW3363988.1 hypothetical protein [Pontibacter populi]